MAEIKRKSQGDKNNSSNLISLGNSSNNLTNNRIKSKIKETPKDILYGSSNINNQLKLKQDDYKSKLLDILGNHATQGDVLYGKPEDLEKKVKQYGLNKELEKQKNRKTGTNTINASVTLGQSNLNKNNVHYVGTNDKKDIKYIKNEYSKPTEKGYITSSYGYRIHPVHKTKKFHDGIDIGMPIGTQVNSVTDGIVTKARWVNGYGNYIKVEYKNFNGDKIEIFYAHLNDFKTNDGKILKEGQIVKRGEQIGHSGNTGIGTGAHLHLGARKNGISINPTSIIGNVYLKR